MKSSSWLFTKEELQDTPSNKDSITYDEEQSLILENIHLIDSLCPSSRSNIYSSACILFRRFYMCTSIKKYDITFVAISSVLLASKIEESLIKPSNLVKQYLHIQESMNTISPTEGIHDTVSPTEHTSPNSINNDIISKNTQYSISETGKTDSEPNRNQSNIQETNSFNIMHELEIANKQNTITNNYQELKNQIILYERIILSVLDYDIQLNNIYDEIDDMFTDLLTIDTLYVQINDNMKNQLKHIAKDLHQTNIYLRYSCHTICAGLYYFAFICNSEDQELDTNIYEFLNTSKSSLQDIFNIINSL